MKITELIEALKEAEREHGDVECLIEVFDDGAVYLMPVGEVSFEDRDQFGESVCLIE